VLTGKKEADTRAQTSRLNQMIESLSARIRERPLLMWMVILLVVCLNAWFAFRHPLELNVPKATRNRLTSRYLPRLLPNFGPPLLRRPGNRRSASSRQDAFLDAGYFVIGRTP
jgi:hypothetical protein